MLEEGHPWWKGLFKLEENKGLLGARGVGGWGSRGITPLMCISCLVKKEWPEKAYMLHICYSCYYFEIITNNSFRMKQFYDFILELAKRNGALQCSESLWTKNAKMQKNSITQKSKGKQMEPRNPAWKHRLLSSGNWSLAGPWHPFRLCCVQTAFSGHYRHNMHGQSWSLRTQNWVLTLSY